MIRNNWTVTEKSTRPAGKADRCFYCSKKIGEQHKEDCVIRSKTVLVDFTVRVVVDIPEHWSKDDIEFKYNEGSWCADNLLDMIDRDDCDCCLCHFMTATYVGDATKEDEASWGLIKIEELDS